jgi:hypothetical protein
MTQLRITDSAANLGNLFWNHVEKRAADSTDPFRWLWIDLYNFVESETDELVIDKPAEEIWRIIDAITNVPGWGAIDVPRYAPHPLILVIG